MSTLQLNLWSLTLMPGERVPIYIRRDFQITNAALGEELADENARTVVKVTHSPIPINLGMMDSDDGEDFDDDMVVGSDDESDDEIPEEDSAEGDDADEMDEDDSDIDSDEDDFDQLEESVICALTPGRIEQAQLNLTFIQGEVVVFETVGPNAVHLMGNYIYQGGESDDEDDSDMSGDEFSDLDSDDEFDVEEFDEEIEVAPKGKITAVEDDKPKPKTKSFAAVVADKPDTPKSAKADKKRKADEIEATPTKADELSKSQKKKLAKKTKLEAGATESPAPKKEAKKEAKVEPKKDSKKKTLPSGLVIEDVKVGSGPVAKAGKRLGMRYIGKLENGKQFDSNTGGKPFSFVLGRGEVISGWDQGLAGMAVGGERCLTIPAKLAYGTQRIPGIPPNSTLKFEVKLVSIN
ncbi:hypothetical protein CspHIS471_0206830 [Cutaneotrichosporon sp. HIS471]|nr:hypothetical protein CspHIS471_0206830 [Cutaneotrichosporon sp. HIS471]